MATNRTTRAGYHIANHLGMDGDCFEDECRYQPTRWTRPVYTVGNDYWAAGGAKPPQHRDSNSGLKWTRVVSSYDRKTVLWHGTEAATHAP